MNIYNVLDKLKAIAEKDPHYRDAANNTQAYGFKTVSEGVHGETCNECGMYESHCECPEGEVMEGDKPDFLDLDKDGNKKESMKKAAADKKEVKESPELRSILKHAGIAMITPSGTMAAQADSLVESINKTKSILNENYSGGLNLTPVAEVGYSAKKASAGKDIGKPGKNFSKIAKSAGERYGSKEAGERVAGAVLAKLRAKESVGEDAMDESALQAYLGKKKYGEEGMKALQKAGRNHASKETMAKIRTRYDKMDEAGMVTDPQSNDEMGAYDPPLGEANVNMPDTGDDGRNAAGVTLGEQEKTHKGGTITKTDKGIKHKAKEVNWEDEDEDEESDEPRGRGRPKKKESEKTSASLPWGGKAPKASLYKLPKHKGTTWGMKGGEKFSRTVKEGIQAANMMIVESYPSWKREIRAAYPGVAFQGNVSKCRAMVEGVEVAAFAAPMTEKAPPGDKYERMVKHIKQGYAKDGKLTPQEKSIAYATAWKKKNAEMDEGVWDTMKSAMTGSNPMPSSVKYGSTAYPKESADGMDEGVLSGKDLPWQQPGDSTLTKTMTQDYKKDIKDPGQRVLQRAKDMALELPVKEASTETFVTDKGNRYTYVLGDDEMKAQVMFNGTEIHLQYDPNMQAFDPQESRAKDPILNKWLKRQQPFGSDEDSIDDFVDQAMNHIPRGSGKETDLDEVSKGEYLKQQDAAAEKSGKDSFKAFGQDFSTKEIDETIAVLERMKALAGMPVKEESDAEKDDKAEKAAKKVAKDVEYDDKRDHDDTDAEKRDDDAEEDGEEVKKDIEYDDKKDSEEKDEDKDKDDKDEKVDESEESKSGGYYGKGVYEAYESQFQQMVAEDINVSTNQSSTGDDTVTVTATQDDAQSLVELLKMAGMGREMYQKYDPGTCAEEAVTEENSGNTADATEYGDVDELVNRLSGGLNGMKLQYAKGYKGDNDITTIKGQAG
jgi:hypothetical protein